MRAWDCAEPLLLSEVVQDVGEGGEQKQKEVDAIRLRPHPMEYQLCYDI